MVKKDRIAIVITIIYSILPLLVLTTGKVDGFIGLMMPPLLYWCYRFIKGDISFIKNNK